MTRSLFIFLVLFLAGCSTSSSKSPLVVKKELVKELKEISGISFDGGRIWAITDKPHATVYKLDLAGNLLQVVNIKNEEATDVEAVTSDAANVYVGDVGDNDGSRIERTIFKIAKSGINEDKETGATAEKIEFTFPGEGNIEKKKKNNFDCESLMSYKDSLYVFTKDRQDNETRLYALPKSAGKYTARYVDSFNCAGLITDAAMNPSENELSLIGYHKGHKYPFIVTFNHFKGNDFFSGTHRLINLADKPWDWQLEGITYGTNDVLYFSCEGTEEVPATFYGIKLKDILKLSKDEPEEKEQKHKHNESGLSKKGHLKM